MNKILLSLLVSFTSTLCAIAGEIPVENATPGHKFDVSVSSHIYSEYILNGCVIYNKPVIQSDITIASSTGLSLNIWGSADFKSGDTWGNEVDYTLAYDRSILGFDVGVSVSYFDCFKLLNKEGDSVDLKGKISRDWVVNEKNTLTPFVELNYYIPTEGHFGRGCVVEGGLKHSFQITKAISFGHQLSLIHDDGAFGCDSGNVLKYQASVTAQLTSHISFDTGVQYYKMLSSFKNDSRGADGDQVVGYAGFVYNW